MIRQECRTTTRVALVADDHGEPAIVLGDVKLCGPLILTHLETAVRLLTGQALGEVLDDEWFAGRDYTRCEGSGDPKNRWRTSLDDWCLICASWQPCEDGRIVEHTRRTERVPS